MPELPDIRIPVPQNGLVREAAVDETLVPENTVEWSQNLTFDRIGAITLRKGLAALGGQVEPGAPVLGMALYRNNAGTTYRLLAKVDQNVYAYNGSSWASVRASLTASSKARFTNLVDYTFMVNGTGNQALNTYNASGNFGTTNDGDLPAGDYIENYRNRIWVAQATVDKLYYSDVVATDNTITGGTSFLQISPADGEKITGLKRHPRALLVFKQNHVYRVFSINSTDPDPSILRGTNSQESIIESKQGIHYHHSSGFYNLVFDGAQQEISRPIIDIVQAISRANYDNVCGWADDDHLYWSVGDITLGGVSFNNVVTRYTLSTQVWTVYTYAQEIRSAAVYDNGTTLRNVVGDHDGNVLVFDSGTTDNSDPIFYDLITHWYYFTDIRATRKTLNAITSLHENAAGGNLSYQVDREGPNEWTPIGSLSDDLFKVHDNFEAKFSRIRFRLSGNSSGSPFIFRGFEALGMMTEGVQKDG